MTPLDGLMNFGVGDYQKVRYAPGCADTACEGGDLIPDAVADASNADAVVLVVGLTQEQETESLDRTLWSFFVKLFIHPSHHPSMDGII